MTGFTVDISHLTSHDDLQQTLQTLADGIPFHLKGGCVTWMPTDKGQSDRVEDLRAASAGEYFNAACRGLPDGVYRPTTTPDANTIRAIGNPYSPGTFNLTRQLEMERDTPAHAELFRSQADREAEAQRNPFAQGPHFNVTEQLRLLRDNPQLAAQLEASAGHR